MTNYHGTSLEQLQCLGSLLAAWASVFGDLPLARSLSLGHRSAAVSPNLDLLGRENVAALVKLGARQEIGECSSLVFSCCRLLGSHQLTRVIMPSQSHQLTRVIMPSQSLAAVQLCNGAS